MSGLVSGGGMAATNELQLVEEEQQRMELLAKPTAQKCESSQYTVHVRRLKTKELRLSEQLAADNRKLESLHKM